MNPCVVVLLFAVQSKMTQFDQAKNTDLALKAVLFSAIAVVIALLIYKLKILLVSLILAVTLASAMSPLVEGGERRKIPRQVTVLMLYLMVMLSYTILAALLAPAIHEQLHKLNDNLPAYLSGVSHWYQSVLNIEGNNSDMFAFNIDDIRKLGFMFLQQTLDMTAGFVGLLLNAVLIVFLAAYFVVEANKIWNAIFRWLPPPIRVKVAPLILPLASRMGGYVRGQLLVALGVGAFLITGFSLLGLKYALVLGILAGLLNLFPYIGSLIACAFAIVVAFNQAPILAGAVLVLYAAEQWFESTLLVPCFVGRHSLLHPLVVLIVIIVGASLMGVPGALISVPVTSCAMFLIEEFYVKQFECWANDRSLN